MSPTAAVVVVPSSVVAHPALEDDAATWQVQTTKSRRLGPQHSLSRQDLEEQTNKLPLEDAKKKGENKLQAFYFSDINYSVMHFL